MNPVFNWIVSNQAAAAVAGYWIFSALVSGMPEPKDASGVGYVWLYNSLHFLASNLNAMVSRKNPSYAEPPHVTPQAGKGGSE